MEITAAPIWLMVITFENQDSLASIKKKHIIYKKVKMYTNRKLQKYLYTVGRVA